MGGPVPILTQTKNREATRLKCKVVLDVLVLSFCGGWKHQSVWEVIIRSVFYSEDNIWTIMKNNMSAQTSVPAPDPDGKAVFHINYNVTDEQVNTQKLFMPFWCCLGVHLDSTFLHFTNMLVHLKELYIGRRQVCVRFSESSVYLLLFVHFGKHSGHFFTSFILNSDLA